MTTALFLGRFQPPHVGHLLTIRSLATKYEHLVVGVTECQPAIMPVDNVIRVLKQLVPDQEVLFIPVPGSVEGGTADISVDFDVCCSGNPAVLSIMANKGYKAEYTERSLDDVYSGTNERERYIENALDCSINFAEKPVVQFKLVDTDSLRPIEKINPRHYGEIEADIMKQGTMLMPLIVDKASHAVLDGSHRYAFLVKHGYRFAPVLLCEYDDESIFVGTHLGHRFEHNNSKWISKKHVRATAISGNLYEPRTTRHFFPFRKKSIPTELAILKAGQSASIEHLIADVSKEEELSSNRQYISELKYESEILSAYIDEQNKVLSWLESQNEQIAKA